MRTAPDPPLTHSEERTLGRLVGVGSGRAGGQSETTLVLTGGGWRAALFHLGALTRLNELGMLGQLDTVGAVAGGGILAALLATRVPWPLSGAFREWPEQVAAPMRELARRNARARALLRPSLASRGGGVLEERYARELLASHIGRAPARPRFVLGAAGVVLGEMGADRGEELDWELGDASAEQGYDAALVREAIETVRTDLDAFADAEQAVLENHGYLLADAAVRERGAWSGGIEPLPPEPPHPLWMNRARAREALAASSRRTRLGRLRAPRQRQRRDDPQPASPELTALLERWRPWVRYDSLEAFRADSVAMVAGLAVGGRCNTLHRADGELLAAVAPEEGEAKLSLDFLGAPAYANGQPASRSDYLDECGGSHAADSRRLRRTNGNNDVVYGRAKREGGHLWLQYWFFYYYNDKGLLNVGQHEGDWEMIQLRLGPGDEPDAATYGHHGTGERAGWEEVETHTDGGVHAPLVYPARGSHASRLRRGSYTAPMVPDHNDGRGPLVRPRLVAIGDDGPGWVLWPGRWGATRRRQYFEADSPRGPREQACWWSPASFHREARVAAEVAPGERAEIGLAPPPEPRLSALRDDGRAVLAYRFDREGRETERPSRLLVAPVGDGEEPLAAQAFS
ncbi:MAG TPA: patatin-like phospholipase family protein, partial [Solirubrobacterales bacterium]|nr:patatin-like phospholipase family protein [Solirubrobacterales bacterium]